MCFSAGRVVTPWGFEPAVIGMKTRCPNLTRRWGRICALERYLFRDAQTNIVHKTGQLLQYQCKTDILT